jgi:hypothetical protein
MPASPAVMGNENSEPSEFRSCAIGYWLSVMRTSITLPATRMCMQTSENGSSMRTRSPGRTVRGDE